MIASFCGAAVVTAGFSAGESCPRILHVKLPCIRHISREGRVSIT
ncbi:hypothetical protein P4475_11410 [Halalkalibacterium halodurans]|nr:hypothetical protein [Halalkalibacterium halodurans]